MVTKTFCVTGRVQGVGFRWAAQEAARRLELAGWVCNENDGSVSGLIQGDESAVGQFVAWLWRGPRGAAVKNVDVEPAEPTGLRLFTIRSVVE